MSIPILLSTCLPLLPLSTRCLSVSLSVSFFFSLPFLSLNISACLSPYPCLSLLFRLPVQTPSFYPLSVCPSVCLSFFSFSPHFCLLRFLPVFLLLHVLTYFSVSLSPSLPAYLTPSFYTLSVSFFIAVFP